MVLNKSNMCVPKHTREWKWIWREHICKAHMKRIKKAKCELIAALGLLLTLLSYLYIWCQSEWIVCYIVLKPQVKMKKINLSSQCRINIIRVKRILVNVIWRHVKYLSCNAIDDRCLYLHFEGKSRLCQLIDFDISIEID